MVTLPTSAPGLLARAWRSQPERPVARLARGRRRQVVTAREAVARVAAGAAELRRRGVRPGDRVAIRGEDRWEWLLADLAVLSVGAVSVGLAWAGAADETRAALEQALPVAALGPVPGLEAWDLPREASAGGVEDWERGLGRLDPEAPAAISYTSGSRGEPRGALLTHRNLAFLVEALPARLAHRPDDAYLSYLSVHRVGARQDLHLCLACGIPYCVPAPGAGFAASLAALEPTILWHTPRFFRELHARVKGLAGPLARLGGRFWRGSLRLAFSCGGPLEGEVERDLAAWGLPTCNFYGMTEATSGVSTNLPGAFRPGTVGRPLPGLEVRLDPEGEVLLRGPSVMAGYLGAPEATTEVLRDGWLHTGDLGILEEGGYLRLEGRRKDLLLLADGRNVPLGLLEARLEAVPGIRRAVVVGEGRSAPGALLLLEEGLRLEDLRPALQAALADRPAWERVVRFALLPRDLSREAGEVAPSGKVRRPVVLRQFAGLVEALYSGGS